MDRGFMTMGLPVGQIAGIAIYVHWLLLAQWIFGLDRVIRPGSQGSDVLEWLLMVVLMFGSILLHELGHCFAARKVGGHADEIILWPLGGLAFCDCPRHWKAHFIVAAGGPLVTVAIIALSYPAFHFVGEAWPELWLNEYFGTAHWILVGWNILILIFNLIPLYPMDGGRIFHALAWRHYSRQGGYEWGGYSRANRLTLYVSRGTAIAGLVWAAWDQNLVLVVLILFMLMQAETLKQG
jgi:Zn-dependent protease